MRRQSHILPLLLIAVVVGGLTAATAVLIDWLPEGAAEQAGRVDTLMWFLVWCSIIIFTGVVTALLYSVWRFRAPKGDESDGPPIHGHTKLEIIWTVIPVLLLAVVAVWAYVVLSENEARADDRLQVEVVAEQFAWTFTYRDAGITTGDLRVPVGRQVELKMRSKDVLHSFYVAEFRVKKDVVPGITTYLNFDPNKAGTYQIICAELCGVGHGVMRSRVIVMEPTEYAAWVSNSQAQIRADAAPEAEDTPAADADDQGQADEDASEAAAAEPTTNQQTP